MPYRRIPPKLLEEVRDHLQELLWTTSMMKMTEQLGQVIQHWRIADRTLTTVGSSDIPQTTGLTMMFPPPLKTTTFPAPVRPDVNNLMSAMEELECSTGVLLRASPIDGGAVRRPVSLPRACPKSRSSLLR